MTRFSKSLTALAAAATLAVVAVAAPQPAEARGGGLAAGIIGGLAAGAIIGAAANGPYLLAPGPYYYGPAPVYYGPLASGPASGSGTATPAPGMSAACGSATKPG